MKLYDIPQEIEAFEQKLIENGGELTPELEAEWSAFISEGKEKLQAAGFVLLRLKSDVETIKNEVARLDKRKKQSEANKKRLSDLTLYALQSFGGKVKTALINMWTGRTARQVTMDVKPGTDLVELQKTHPDFVRVKYEPNIEQAKAVYEPLWKKFEEEREAEYLKAGETLTDEKVREQINAKLDARWQEMLKASGLPDCFLINTSASTEYLVVK